MALVRAEHPYIPRPRVGDANIDIEAEPVAAIVPFVAAPAGDDWSFTAEQRAVAAAPHDADYIRTTFRLERDRAERRDREIRAEAALAGRELRADQRRERDIAAATNVAERDRIEQVHALAIANIDAERARIQGRDRDDGGSELWTMFLNAILGIGSVDFTLGPKTTRLEYSLKMPRKMELEMDTEMEPLLVAHPKLD